MRTIVASDSLPSLSVAGQNLNVKVDGATRLARHWVGLVNGSTICAQRVVPDPALLALTAEVCVEAGHTLGNTDLGLAIGNYYARMITVQPVQVDLEGSLCTDRDGDCPAARIAVGSWRGLRHSHLVGYLVQSAILRVGAWSLIAPVELGRPAGHPLFVEGLIQQTLIQLTVDTIERVPLPVATSDVTAMEVDLHTPHLLLSLPPLRERQWPIGHLLHLRDVEEDLDDIEREGLLVPKYMLAPHLFRRQVPAVGILRSQGRVVGPENAIDGMLHERTVGCANDDFLTVIYRFGVNRHR